MRQADLVEGTKGVSEEILEESIAFVLVFNPSLTGLTVGDCHCNLPFH